VEDHFFYCCLCLPACPFLWWPAAEPRPERWFLWLSAAEMMLCCAMLCFTVHHAPQCKRLCCLSLPCSISARHRCDDFSVCSHPECITYGSEYRLCSVWMKFNYSWREPTNCSEPLKSQGLLPDHSCTSRDCLVEEVVSLNCGLLGTLKIRGE